MIHKRDMTIWLPFCVLGVAIILLFYRILFGEVFFWGLPSLQFYPWRWFAVQELRNNQLPFWNPYNGSGAPLLANYQSAILYPPNWLYVIIPSPYAMGLIALLHIFWAGLGMWNFTGKLELSTFGRGISLLAYALGSYSLGRLGSFPTANAAAWIPWLFWGCFRVLEMRRANDVGILGLITGLLLLTGHAQTSWYAFVSLGLFALWYVIWQLRSAGRQTQLIALALSGIGLLLGAGIAAWQIVMTLEFLDQSHRAGGVSYEILTNLSYAPLRILGMISPHIYGTPADGSYLTPDTGIYFEDAAYIGFLPLISAIFAITGWFKWRKFLPHHPAFRSVPFWALLSVLGLVLALGYYGPFYRFLYDHVPTFDNFREPVRWLILPAFGLSILAGIGVHNWNTSQRALFWTRLSAAGGLSIVVVSLLATQFIDVEGDAINVLSRAFTILGFWIIGSAILTLTCPTTSLSASLGRWQLVVLIFVAADLMWAVDGLNPSVSSDFYERDLSITQPNGRLYWFEDYEEDVKFERYFDLGDYRRAQNRWAEIRTSLLPNLNILDRISIFNNFDPLQPSVHRQYVELIEAAGEDATKLLRAAAIGEVYGKVQPKGWEAGEQPNIYSAPSTPPEVWLVASALWAADNMEAKEQLMSPSWNPDDTVILQGNPQPIENPQPCMTIEVQTFGVRATRYQYQVVSSGDCYLVVSHTWYPGWKATLDGQTVDLYQANLSFQAVYIPDGGGDVVLSYTPRGTGISAIVSIVSVFLTLGLIAFGLFRNQTTNLTS